MAPNLAVFHRKMAEIDEREAAEEWCQEHFVEMEACPDGKWHFHVWAKKHDVEVEVLGEGFMGAYRLLRDKVKEMDVQGSFEGEE